MQQPSRSGHEADTVIIGGGIAGIVTALELLEGGRPVLLVDRDRPERFGGLARWAFGGMALVGTPEQRRMGVTDSPALALEDWIRFGELGADEVWPRAWAACYVEESRTGVYDWLRRLGLRFMPAVNWVERGSSIKGNTVPRYHILWGTGLELVENLSGRLQPHVAAGRLTMLHRHRVSAVEVDGGAVVGCRGVDEESGREFTVRAGRTVVATGGVNGSVEQVRRHWPADSPGPPEVILNGAHPYSDGALHAAVAACGGCLTHLSDMWNYAAGIPHPQAHFDGHGLSLVPPKSLLWLDPDGAPVGPAPMVTGFDTHEMCRQVAAHPYTWQVLNWRVAAKELAISGSQHNPRILRHQLLRFLLDLLTGNDRLLRQMVSESTEFLVARSPRELAAKMNDLTGTDRVKPERLDARLRDHDAVRADRTQWGSDPAIQRILEVRRWRSDRLRTSRLRPLCDPRAGPLLAIRLHYVSRKSLGGIQTDLQSRALGRDGVPIPGLFAVGEAAGFGGGGACGRRSLEGTFLSGCILTTRKAAEAILQG
jgi:uncharacterized protein